MSDRKSFAEIADKISSETNLNSDQVRYIGRKIFAEIAKSIESGENITLPYLTYIPMYLEANYEKNRPAMNIAQLRVREE